VGLCALELRVVLPSLSGFELPSDAVCWRPLDPDAELNAGLLLPENYDPEMMQKRARFSNINLGLPGGGSARLRAYANVCAGGTFDRLHAGHKVLLSSAALATSQNLLIGITSDSLLSRKTLPELIQPIGIRACAARQFLASVSPQLGNSSPPSPRN